MTEFGLSFEIYPQAMASVSSIMGNGSIMVKLSLTATSEVNGTSVTCHATTDHITSVTAPAYLYVQGQYNTFIYCKYYYFLPDGQ